MKFNNYIIAVALFAVAGFAFAQSGKVFLNGVDITGLSNQKFENCNVQLDAEGNVNIIAPQYRIKTKGSASSSSQGETSSAAAASSAASSSASSASTGSPLTKRYYLVTSFSVESRADFDIDIFINGKFYKRILSQDDQVIEEVTSLFDKGENRIVISAAKNIVAGAPVSMPDSFLQVIIGEARMQKNEVVIERPLINYRLTGAQSGTIHKTFKIATE